jgi:hypothetical protein
MSTRVARWYIFKTKSQNWVNLGGSCNGRCWYIFGHLIYFTFIWNSLWTIGTFRDNLVYIFPVLVCCTKINLSTMWSTLGEKCITTNRLFLVCKLLKHLWPN